MSTHGIQRSAEAAFVRGLDGDVNDVVDNGGNEEGAQKVGQTCGPGLRERKRNLKRQVAAIARRHDRHPSDEKARL